VEELQVTQRTLSYDQAGSAVTVKQIQGQDLGMAAPLAGRYKLLEKLGSGGFGEVWAAEDLKLGRHVAVKRVRVTEVDRERLTREARAAARVNHPAVVALYETFELAGSVYFVSELVEGKTLSQLTRECVLSDRDVVTIGSALAGALQAAHSCGVIHRDVKPDNVLVPESQRTGDETAKLVDFGIAHLADDVSITRTGDVMGTVAYMSPEQTEGLKATEATDIYSLALTLYEAFTGTNPLCKANAAATIKAVSNGPALLSDVRKDLPTELCEAVDTALEPDPDLRGSMKELKQALDLAVREVSDAPHSENRNRKKAFQVTAPSWLGRLGYLSSVTVVAATTLLLMTSYFQLGQPWNSVPLTVGAAVAVTLVPRYFWPLILVGAVVLLATGQRSLTGDALLVAVSGVLTVLLLLRTPKLWLVALAAPLLGLIGLAPLFPAVGVFIDSWVKRAALGFSGAIWLLTVEILTGRSLYLNADGVLSNDTVHTSVQSMLTGGLYPLATSGLLTVAAVWAVATVTAPFVLAERPPLVAAALAGCWSVAVFTGGAAVGALANPKGDFTETLSFLAITGVVMAVAVLRSLAGRRVVTSTPASVA